MTGQVLVVDVGTSSARAAVIDADAHVVTEHRAPLLPDSPAPGLVEFDAVEMATTAVGLAEAALATAGAVDAVGIANQRGSAIVWDRTTGEPVGPGIGWQDLRTVGRCLELRPSGLRSAQPLGDERSKRCSTRPTGPDADLSVGTVDFQKLRMDAE